MRIVFYDTSKNNENAVFCRYEGNEAVFKTGEKDELLEEMKTLDKAFPRNPTGFYLKAFGLILLFFSLFVAAVWKFIGGFFPVFGAFVFYVIELYPHNAAVFVRLDKKFLMFRRFEKIGHVKMKMGRNVFSAFFVTAYGNDFQGKNFFRNRFNIGYSAFFLCFPLRNLKQIGFAVGVAAHPGPGIIDVVIDHQNLRSFRVKDPGGRSEMRPLVFSFKNVRL